MQEINHEYYVSPEVAKLLKEAGFDLRVRYMYRNNNPTLCICTETSYRNIPKPNKCPMYWQYAAPTLEVAQGWLRDVKRLFICIIPEIKDYKATWNFYICNEQGFFYENENCFLTYEEAFEAGIKKALELILEKGE